MGFCEVCGPHSLAGLWHLLAQLSGALVERTEAPSGPPPFDPGRRPSARATGRRGKRDPPAGAGGSVRFGVELGAWYVLVATKQAEWGESEEDPTRSPPGPKNRKRIIKTRLPTARHPNPPAWRNKE